ncbi:MAG TPA: BlaI/MecI/CopY family transcriptional regulator [Kofleriaceae bacterium]|nr:BlaI/MecI/CopY family transcriptional regulator [Kofleriaceae bacterium]
MARPPELTPAEFNLMKVLWRLGKATVADARAELNRPEHVARKGGGELAYTTVMTLLGRLAAKGAVEVDREREPFVYKPVRARETVLKDRLRDFLHEVFDGQADAMVLGLVEDESISIDELRAIERRIEAVEGTTDATAGGDDLAGAAVATAGARPPTAARARRKERRS